MMSDGMDQDTSMYGMTMVGRDSSIATDTSDGWVRPPIPILMSTPHETGDSIVPSTS